MRLSIPRVGPYSEWRQRFLACSVQELTAALQDCLDYAGKAEQATDFMRAMCYRDVWPKLLRERIAELSQGRAA